MQALSGELFQKLETLGETLEQQGKKIQMLGEQQASLKESLKEIKETIGAGNTPQRRTNNLSLVSHKGDLRARPSGGGSSKTGLLSAGSGSSPLVSLFGSKGKQIVRQAIVDGTVSAGIQEFSDFLKQIQELIENILKIIDMVRHNLDAPTTQAAAGGIPALSKNTVEVMAKMIKMPEFQRLMAGMLTQTLRE